MSYQRIGKLILNTKALKTCKQTKINTQPNYDAIDIYLMKFNFNCFILISICNDFCAIFWWCSILVYKMYMCFINDILLILSFIIMIRISMLHCIVNSSILIFIVFVISCFYSMCIYLINNCELCYLPHS